MEQDSLAIKQNMEAEKEALRLQMEEEAAALKLRLESFAQIMKFLNFLETLIENYLFDSTKSRLC
jgi:hypothetical protein